MHEALHASDDDFMVFIIPLTHVCWTGLENWPRDAGGVVTTHVGVPEEDDPAAALAVRLAFVDPVNRIGELTMVNVP